MAKKKLIQQETQVTLIAAERRDLEVGLEDLAGAMAAPYLAIDIETETRYPGTGPDKDFGLSYAAPVVVISLTWPKRLMVDGNHEYGVIVVAREDGTNYPSTFTEALKERFTRLSPVIAHNAVFDMRGLGKILDCATPEYVWDTMVMERLLNPAVGKAYGLLQVADAHRISYPAFMQDMKTQRTDLHKLPLEDVVKYAAADTQVALKIYEAQQRLINDEKTQELVSWEIRAMREYCRMAARGVALNREYTNAYLLELHKKREAAAERLCADGLIDPGKRLQALTYIYRTKHVPLPAFNPTSVRFTDSAKERHKADPALPVSIDDMSLNAAALKDIIGMFSHEDDESDWLAHTDTENAKRLADFIDWKQSTYLIGVLTSLLEHSCIDGRVHSLVTIDTQANRRSSKNPQVQNLPFPAMAGVLTGGDDYTLVELDLSNAENWFAALLSGDHNFAKACSSADFHSAMAAQYFRSVWTEADADTRKKLRKMGKAVTFLYAYGGGAALLASRLNIPLEEAQAIFRAKDTAFPMTAEAKRLAGEKAKSVGFVNLWTRRKIPVSPNATYRAWNYCCQGAVAELVKRGLVRISEIFAEKGLKSFVALDMHDALIIAIKHNEFDAAIAIASHTMETIVPQALNARTNPPIRWIARPDIDENKKKWGKGQHHPEPGKLPTEIYTAESASEAEALLTDAEKEKPKPETLHTVQISHPDLGFSCEVVEGETLLEINGKQTRVKPESLITYYELLIKAIQTEVTRPRRATMPDGKEVQVDLVNYAKVCERWVESGKGTDDPDQDGFWWSAWFNQTVEKLTSLQARYSRAESWLGALYQMREAVQRG